MLLQDFISMKISDALVDFMLIFTDLMQTNKNMEDNVGIP